MNWISNNSIPLDCLMYQLEDVSKPGYGIATQGKLAMDVEEIRKTVRLDCCVCMLPEMCHYCWKISFTPNLILLVVTAAATTFAFLSLSLMHYAPTSTLACNLYLAVIPPSTLITPPVMKSFSNKKSTALATSAQVPSLFRGCIAAACSLVYAPPL